MIIFTVHFIHTLFGYINALTFVTSPLRFPFLFRFVGLLSFFHCVQVLLFWFDSYFLETVSSRKNCIVKDRSPLVFLSLILLTVFVSKELLLLNQNVVSHFYNLTYFSLFVYLDVLLVLANFCYYIS